MKTLLIPLAWLVILSTPLAAQTYTVLHTFTNSPDGANPYARPALAGGTLFGATDAGGSAGDGTLFKIGTNGTGYGILRSFNGSPDGANPDGDLIQVNASLFGTTYSGGGAGDGTVFQIGTNGSSYLILRSFTNNPNGGGLLAGVVGDGKILYGTTAHGGTALLGTEFSINSDGVLFQQRNFQGLNVTPYDGLHPLSSLVLSSNVLYGTTEGGGTNTSGTVFCVGTNGTGYTILKHFNFNNGDGYGPRGALLLVNGTLYGTTVNGGTFNMGNIFKLGTNGSGFTVLKSFPPGSFPGYTNSDGAFPYGTLALSGDALYGTTYEGGAWGFGVIFQIKTNGTGFAVLKSFTGTDGANPWSGVVVSGKTLFGTTRFGGSSDNGVLYKLTIPPPPPEILVNYPSFGIVSGRFGFSISGESNLQVVIEACTSLATPVWVPLRTNILSGLPSYFSDGAWSNYPGRYYRARVR